MYVVLFSTSVHMAVNMWLRSWRSRHRTAHVACCRVQSITLIEISLLAVTWNV